VGPYFTTTRLKRRGRGRGEEGWREAGGVRGGKKAAKGLEGDR
jgi:hypothetical protein